MQLSFWFVFLWWHMLWNIFVISLFTICISFWWGNSSGLLTIFYSIFFPLLLNFKSTVYIFNYDLLSAMSLQIFFFGLWWLVCSFSWDPFFLISFFPLPWASLFLIISSLWVSLDLICFFEFHLIYSIILTYWVGYLSIFSLYFFLMRLYKFPFSCYISHISQVLFDRPNKNEMEIKKWWNCY